MTTYLRRDGNPPPVRLWDDEARLFSVHCRATDHTWTGQAHDIRTRVGQNRLASDELAHLLQHRETP